MVRFLSRSAVFAGLVLLLFGGWGAAVVGVELTAYRREIRMPAAAHTLVCGDSQPAHALDPALWPGLFNFSLDGSLLDQCRMKTADVLAANPGRVRTLLLDISPLKFYVRDPHAALIDEGAAAAQMLVNLLHWRENRRPLRGFAKIFRDTLLVKKTGQLNRLFSRKRPYRSTLRGGYVRTERAHCLNNPARAARSIRHLAEQINAAPQAGTGTAVFDEWRSTIETARRAGVERIVLITTPLHPQLRAALADGRLADFRQRVRAFARDAGCPYLDFLDFAVPDAGWRDGNHLNVKGAALFTAACRKAVEP